MANKSESCNSWTRAALPHVYLCCSTSTGMADYIHLHTNEEFSFSSAHIAAGLKLLHDGEA